MKFEEYYEKEGYLDEERGCIIENICIGTIQLATGRLIVCDPLAPYDRIELKCGLKPGKYGVFLIISKDLQNKEEIIEAAYVKDNNSNFSVTWNRAPSIPYGLNEKLKPSEDAGYGVDTGIGCFMDASVADKHFEMLDHPNYLDDTMKFFYERKRPRWLELCTEPSGNIFLFESGLGDGVYITWIAHSFQCDSPYALLTDFSHTGIKHKTKLKKPRKSCWKIWRF
ncbi:MAG: DUF4241 domain-containing protein [Candidatus Electrothrix sp. Rat3]|nr:DUF4241 domain-containing protein [Candidatus Electrothrix rattekaaiensis]WLE96451.1 MAG: DUF4241 domain-containing protein [Candidatus Electrothrix communis]